MICHIFARAAVCEKRCQALCRRGGRDGRGGQTGHAVCDLDGRRGLAGHAACDFDGRQRPARSPLPQPPPQPPPQPRRSPPAAASPRLPAGAPLRLSAEVLPDKAPPRPFPWLGATQKTFLKKVLSLALPKDVSEKGITFNSFFRNVFCMRRNVMRSIRSRWLGQTRRYRSKPALGSST